MSITKKDQTAMLRKLGIDQLNPMQLAAADAIANEREVVLLSPTGTGKTLAFLLPLLERLDRSIEEVQLLVLVPSRELAIQIEQVARELGSGFKINAIYGGRAHAKDRIDFRQPPAILIGTPGRIADHFRRETFSKDHIQHLVLDEFDKSLEVGFEKEMKEIVGDLRDLERIVLTSATQKVQIPKFMDLGAPSRLNFLTETTPQLQLKTIATQKVDKLAELAQLLRQLGKQRGILFCNFKDTIQFVSGFLEEQDIPHICFYGGLEQRERERALIRFRNGTHRLLVATDLAARGIDVPELDFIIHYQFPFSEAEFTHRNGRTARMHADGVAYLMKHRDRNLPDYITDAPEEDLMPGPPPIKPNNWETLFISGGRKDKISKGDIAGLFLKQGGLKKDELGLIELKQDCAFVAVPKKRIKGLIKQLDNTRLKKKKVRIKVLD
ncbi:MAG: DEAD/DEAH box helicase [Bacteroidota bacterium]